MGGAEGARATRDGSGGGGIEQLERADRRQHHRQAQFAAERCDRRIDPGDIAQHPRPECDLVQRHAVAAHRGFGLGGADNVVPGFLVQVAARSSHELVKVLDFFAACAEFSSRRRPDAGRLVHRILSRKTRGFLLGLAFRVSLPELLRHRKNWYGWYQRDPSKEFPVCRSEGMAMSKPAVRMTLAAS